MTTVFQALFIMDFNLVLRTALNQNQSITKHCQPQMTLHRVTARGTKKGKVVLSPHEPTQSAQFLSSVMYSNFCQKM